MWSVALWGLGLLAVARHCAIDYLRSSSGRVSRSALDKLKENQRHVIELAVPDTQKRLLDEVLGDAHIAHDPIEQRVTQPSVAIVQFCHRSRLSSFQTFRKTSIVFFQVNGEKQGQHYTDNRDCDFRVAVSIRTELR
jgi:hypothetical protein